MISTGDTDKTDCIHNAGVVQYSIEVKSETYNSRAKGWLELRRKITELADQLLSCDFR